MELDYLSGYEHYLADEKKASANTASSYLRDVRQFSAWLAGRGLDAAQVSQNDVRGYAQYLKGCAKSEATVVRSVASLKSFYSYLVSRRVLAVNPAKGYTPAKVERKLPEILTGKEVELFLEQPDPSDPKGCRDKAMLELLYATGIRVSELIALDVSDINLTVGFIRCRGNGKERMIPMYRAAVRALRAYGEDVRPQLIRDADETAFFVNLGGERMSPVHGVNNLIPHFIHDPHLFPVVFRILLHIKYSRKFSAGQEKFARRPGGRPRQHKAAEACRTDHPPPQALGWALAYTSLIFWLTTWVYTWVEEISACPSISWMDLRSAPFSSRCAAKEWRRVWGVMSLAMPAFSW